MIEVNIIADKSTGIIHNFVVKGHAGYAKAGCDIVCAAVSALAYATIKALESLYTLEIVESDGFVLCEIKKPDRASILLTKAFVMGTHDISEQYKENVQWHLYEV